MIIIDNKKEGIMCLIEEVDCQNTINTIRYGDPELAYQGMTDKNGIETVDKSVVTNHIETDNTEKMLLGNSTTSDQEENCTISEVDCRKSLSSIGYYVDEEKTEVKAIDEIVNDDSASTSLASGDISGKQIDDTAAEQISIDYSQFLEISKYFSEFDISKFVSSSIIAAAVDYTTNNESESKVTEENDTLNEVKKTLDSMKTEEISGIEDEIETRDNIEMDDTNNVICNKNKFLITEEFSVENKIGFLSLLSVLGFAGIFTDHIACLGFFAFLYFLRYFFLPADEKFKNSLLLASKVGFLTNIIVSVATIVLWLLINTSIIFALGLSVGIAASMITFSVKLEVCIRKS
ncbi:MAG: DUF3796 domain-containing protein [Lachnospiraceae bacterium]